LRPICRVAENEAERRINVPLSAPLDGQGRAVVARRGRVEANLDRAARVIRDLVPKRFVALPAASRLRVLEDRIRRDRRVLNHDRTARGDRQELELGRVRRGGVAEIAWTHREPGWWHGPALKRSSRSRRRERDQNKD